MFIKAITCLSNEEYQVYKPIIPVIEDLWWSRSPGVNRAHAAFIHSNGDFNKYGRVVNWDDVGVRPALNLSLKTSDNLFWYKPEKLIGSKIEYGRYTWTVLDAEVGEIYVLCDDIIARHRFDAYSNTWDTSELKQWLETEGLRIVTT